MEEAACPPTRAFAADAPPDLAFRVEFAAVPSLRFHIEIQGSAASQWVAFSAQIRIAAAQREYRDGEREALRELFGPPPQWSGTLKSLLWMHAAAQTPRFTGSTVVALTAPCTYDFDVAAAKYLHALEGGDVPLEFLFSGMVFYAGQAGLRVAQIPWDKEA